jgi:Pyruvate/2-oxoacid:ferredoxin oxidoreductase delta subunit
VLPIEEIGELVRKARTVVRMPCACRWDLEKKEERCCYAVSYGPEAWYNSIDMSYFGKASDEGLESLTAEAAVNQMEEMEERGAVHTIWTMMTPFIGALCNCSAGGCLAMRTLSCINVETMARAEHVARVDSSLCNGCGLCDAACHFQAIKSFTVEGRPIALVDTHACFGCGLCRRVCPAAAISLILR